MTTVAAATDVKSSKPFARFRGFFWPIHGHEHRKFLALFLMFFLISFNYNVLRTLKETLVVTAKGAGAEVIPFIKVWAMFPSAIFMTFLVTWLANRFSKEKVFYIVMSLFLGYFALFIFYLFPNHESLHLHGSADALQAYLPAGFKGLISMLRHWTFTTFYVMSELWSNIILIVLFWGFVNQITKLEEAKRFYGLFGLGANLSGIFAGQISIFLSQNSFNIPFGNTAWDQSLFMIVSLILTCGIITLALFYWTNKTILNDPLQYCQESAKQEKEMKGKLSLRQSFAHLFKSPYLLYITLIVITYNISINLIEVLWKNQINMLYPDPLDYNLFINQVATWIGVVATLSAVFVSSNAIRILGWTFTALVTPAVLLLTSIAFFGLLLGREFLEYNNIMLFGMAPLTLIVFAGALQNILCRSAKYTLFDATKEMAFVPLSSECKIKGKTIIDGVCNRLGKSSGSVIHTGLLIALGSFAASTPYVGGILLLIIGTWVSAARSLGKAFNELTDKGTTTTLAPELLSEEVSEESEPATVKNTLVEA